MRKFDSVDDLRVRHVLLATDFSEASDAAFHAALKLCSDFNASLQVLNVFEYGVVRQIDLDGQFLQLDRLRKSAGLALESLVNTARRSGISCDGEVGDGIAHVTILERAHSKRVDIIVMGTRSIYGVKRLAFGSTAEAVLRQARCPVFVVGPLASRQSSSGGIVIFATDFHSTTLNALYAAVSFSNRMHLPLHCLSVLPRGLENGTDKNMIPLIVTEALKHVVDEVDGELIPPVCTVIYGSEISIAVVAYAKQWNARLVVLGLRRSSLAVSLIPSHIAFRIMAEAPCPVLTSTYASNRHPGKLLSFPGSRLSGEDSSRATALSGEDFAVDVK